MSRKFIETGDNLPTSNDVVKDPNAREGRGADGVEGPDPADAIEGEKDRAERKAAHQMGNPVKTQ